MTQVNLLPPEIRQRQRTRRRTYIVIGAGAVLVIVVVLFSLLQQRSLNDLRGMVEAQNAANANLQNTIGNLQQYARLQQEAAAEKNTLLLAFADEASFAGMLNDLSRVIPTDSYLTTLSIQITGAPAVGASTANPNIVGTITFSGVALDTDTVATLLQRLENVRGWVNPFVTTVSRAGGLPGFQMNGTVDLNKKDILTKRGLDGAEVLSGVSPT